METKSKSRNQKLIVILLVILIALLIGILAVILGRGALSSISDNDVPKIGYATEATVMLDQASLQAAMDEAMRNAADGNVGLKYQNDAYSENGIDFDCYIANSEVNKYDMFLSIYADAGMTDQLLLTGLVPPGSGFDSITLDHALETGDHTVYVALTQVDTDEESGEQVLKNQVIHTMEFHVTK